MFLLFFFELELILKLGFDLFQLMLVLACNILKLFRVFCVERSS